MMPGDRTRCLRGAVRGMGVDDEPVEVFHDHSSGVVAMGRYASGTPDLGSSGCRGRVLRR